MPVNKIKKWLEPESLALLELWAREGLSEEEIAGSAGITLKTLREWKKKHPEIAAALQKGEGSEAKVEGSLLRRAVGYRYNEVTRELKKDAENGEMRLTVTKIVTKEVQPDTTALMFWLKNRRPELWRDKGVPAENGSVGVRIIDDIFETPEDSVGSRSLSTLPNEERGSE